MSLARGALFYARPVLFLILAAALCRDASADCFPAPPNLVGWWPGDGSATNIAGANQGTLLGGATANTPGFVGSAFNFDGTNGFVQVTNGPLLQPTNLTIEAWVRFNSLNSAGSGGSPAGDQYIVFKQNSRSGNFEGYDLSKTRIGGVDVFSFMVASAAGLEIQILSATTVSTGAWYHVAATRGSNFIQLYVNGVLERQTNVSFPQDYGNFPLYFGTSGQSYWDHKLAGSLDEVSLYNRALTSNEISAIYAAGSAGKCKGPDITTEPQGQTVIAGTNVTFTVVATGFGSLSYQWQSNNVPIAGATNTSLTLTNVQPEAAADYTVVVSNSLGIITSAPATLNVLSPPAITQQPQPQTVLIGQATAFSVMATGTPPLTYQWYLNSTAIAGATTNTLSINPAQGFQAGQYSVAISNTAGFAVSSNAMLTVITTAATLLNVDVGYGVTSSETGFTAIGQTSSDFWNADDWPLNGFTPNLKLADGSGTQVSLLISNTPYSGLNNGSTDPMYAGYDSSPSSGNSTYTLTNLPPGSYDIYLYSSDGKGQVTVGATDYGIKTSFDFPVVNPPVWQEGVQYVAFRNVTIPDTSAPLVITMHPGVFSYADLSGLQLAQFTTNTLAPAVWQNPAGVITTNGSTLVLQTSGTGVPTPGYQWFFNGAPLTNNGHVSGANGNLLTIANAQPGDSGGYFVMLTNPAGSATSTVATVSVGLPPTITQSPASQTIAVGSSPQLTVLADGTAPMAWQWLFNGLAITNNSHRFGTATNTLTISNSVTGDSGGYSVVVTNLFGSTTSSVATLSILNPPAFSKQPVGASVPLGFPVSLNAIVSGTAPYGYQWLFNGSPITNATSLILAITNLTVGQLGNYQLVATNLVGAATSSVAQVTLGTVAVWGNFSPQGGPSGAVWPPAGVSNVVAIAAGSGYNLALRGDGTLVEWGSNPSVTNFPANLSGIVAIAAGDNHALVVRSNGTVSAWGSNTSGQTNVPANLSNVVAVAAGTYHSAALRSDGTVVAWGGTATDAQTNIPAGLYPVTRIDGGGYQTLALRADGTVVSWGGARSPLVPAGLKGVAGISASPSYGGFDLAVDTNGLVTAWGSGLATNVPPGLTGIVAVEAGGFEPSQIFGVGLRSNGTVITWGSAYPGVTNVPAAISNAVAIAAGGSQALALLNDGRPLLLHPPVGGTFYSGRDLILPATAVGNAPLSFQWFKDGNALPNATNQTLVVPSAQAGDAGNYQLIVGNALGVAQSVAVPVTIVDSPPVLMSQPAGGYAYYGSPFSISASVIGSGPLTLQWLQNGSPGPSGTNYLAFDRALPQHGGAYQLIAGNAFGAVTSSVAQISFSRVATWGTGPALSNAPVDLGSVVAVASGWFHALAIKPDGTVAAWGTTANGATNVPPGLSNVVAVSGGNNFSVALKSDGTVAAWGLGSSGQTNVPPGLSNVVAISAGGSHALALRSDGTVAAWGFNGYGQTNVPAGLSNVVAIAAGSFQSLALRYDGSLVGWGLVGKIPALTNVVAISAGYTQNLALQADGTVVSWSSTGAATGLPSGLSNIVAISVGGGVQAFFHCVALKSDGTMVAWGNNNLGQLNVPGALDSAVAISAGGSSTLALLNDRSPVITAQPFSRHVISGTNVTLTSLAVGQPALNYQWFFNNANLPGATRQSLTLTGVNRNSRGLYSMSVSNALGATSSLAAQLDVGGPVRLLPPVAGVEGELSVGLLDSFGGSLTSGDLARFQVLVSSNLVDWDLLPSALTYTNGTLLLQDESPTNHPARFYRILEQ